jgi:ABC-type polysaccharide/polyol phosphate transport system ATPase subunit
LSPSSAVVVHNATLHFCGVRKTGAAAAPKSGAALSSKASKGSAETAGEGASAGAGSALQESFHLRDLQLNVQQGELVAIVGTVGR